MGFIITTHMTEGELIKWLLTQLQMYLLVGAMAHLIELESKGMISKMEQVGIKQIINVRGKQGVHKYVSVFIYSLKRMHNYH